MNKRNLIVLIIAASLAAIIFFAYRKRNQIKAMIIGDNKTIEDLVKPIVKESEGYRSSMYLDAAGLPTIGYGTLIDTPEEQYLRNTTITQEQALQLMTKDLQAPIAYVNTLSGLNVNQKAALVDFMYNVGINKAKNSTLFSMVKSNPNNPKIKEEFLKWVYSKGQKLNGLVNRRTREANLYFS